MTSYSALAGVGELPSEQVNRDLFTSGCQTVLGPSLRAFLETLHEAVMELDTCGTLQWCNAEARRLLHPAQTSGDACALPRIIAEQDRGEFEDWLSNSTNPGSPAVCIVKLANDRSRRLLEFQRWSPPTANLQTNIWILARNLSAWALQMQQVRIRDRLLAGIAQACEALLREVDIPQAVPTALRELGLATGVDRVYLFENEPGQNPGEVVTSQRFEWCQQGIESQLGNPELDRFPLSTTLPEEYQAMRSGHVLGGPVHLMGPAIRSVLEPQCISSALLVPIILGHQFWGFVGFDECHWERDWTEEERATLKAFAGSLGIAIQRRRTQLEVLVSERNLQHVIDGSNDGFWDWHIPSGTVRFSPRLLGMLGYPPNAWPNHVDSWSKRVHPDDLQRVTTDVARHLKGETESYQTEHRMMTASGSWRWILDRGKVVERDASGHAVRAVGVHTDIHPLKETQQALRESENHLMMALSAARMHSFHHDVVGGCVHRMGMQTGCCECGPNELSQDFFGRMHPADATAYQAAFTALSAASPDYTTEYRIPNDDGGECWFCDRGRGTFDASGRLLSVSGVSMNVTTQRRTSAMLERRTELLHGLFEAVPVAVVVMDVDGVLRHANVGAQEVFQRTSAELVGMALRNLLHLPERPQQAKAGGFREATALLPDHTELQVEVSQSSFGPPNDVTRVAVIRDISEHQRAKEQTLRALTRERDLNRLRSNFITLVSHEFRTPLAHILMSAELLQDCYDQMPGSRRTECFTSIKGRVRSLTQMMQDVLTLGELEAGKHAFSPVGVDLNAFAQSIVAEFRASLSPQAIEKAPELRVSLNDCPAQVQLDSRLISTALLNLLSNAAKYSPRGAGAIEFRIASAGDHLVFEVEDAGIGVPVEARPRLFDEFFRARNVGMIPGTGIGLSIVRLCAGLHGGTASYQPAKRTGSLFVVTIPRILAKPDATADRPTI
jgi:PAS domain S-box-containing protein